MTEPSPNSGAEIVDIYDDDGTHNGTGERRTVHRNGAWHRCVHCIIVSRRRRRLEVTFQRRGLALPEYPGLIDVSVAGHLRAGERADEASRREIAEELGIDLHSDRVESLGEFSLVVQNEITFAREWTDVLLISDDRSPSAFTLDPMEVASVVTMGLVAACELWLGLRPTIEATEWHSNARRRIRLGVHDFVNDVPDYWPWLAKALTRRFKVKVAREP